MQEGESLIPCPFCKPSDEDIVVLESPYARAICDARPAIVGHTLVCSKSHVASAFDLTEPAYSHVRVMQQEISRRMYEAFGEVGVYEHGRSMLCRFHVVNPGHIHAHVHILPISFDLIERSGYEHKWNGLPGDSIKSEDRYLYQETGAQPCETWAIGDIPVRRHFVRAELEEVLKQTGKRWIPLTASPDDHDDAVELTAAEISKYDTLKRFENVIALLGPDSLAKRSTAKALSKSTGLVVVDADLISRFWAWLANQLNQLPASLFASIDEAFVKGRAVCTATSGLPDVTGGLEFEGRDITSELFQDDLNPSLRHIRTRIALLDQLDLIVSRLLRIQPSVLLARDIGRHTAEVNLLKVWLTTHAVDQSTQIEEKPDTARSSALSPHWADVRLSTDGLTPETLSDLIREAWLLRFGFEIG